MRFGRVKKFKRERRLKIRKFIVLAIFLPFLCIFAGYLITSLVILPSMAK